jgi:hypothetical protein
MASSITWTGFWSVTAMSFLPELPPFFVRHKARRT